MIGKTAKGFLICVFFSLISGSAVFSQSPFIQTSYRDLYQVGTSTDIQVTKQIELTNLNPDLYISKYQFSFHKQLNIAELSVLVNAEPADFTKTVQNDQIMVKVLLSQPTGLAKNRQTITLNYVLKNYLNQSGITRELLLPISSPSKEERLLSYEVKVITPENYPTLGISKPRMQKLNEQTYVWTKTTTDEVKALYLAFGDKAYYQVNFNYYLINNELFSQELTAALVPDGTFQKAYVQKLEPEPEQMSIDDDGNLLAHYRLLPKQALKVEYSGTVELFSLPRAEIGTYQQLFLPNLHNRYLTQERYWALSPAIINNLTADSLTTSRAIYNYVVDTLEYSTERLNSSLKREGAEWAIENPDKAVCMEYTDLFIALGRENGVPSRSVIGYGLTANDELLPLSFLGDLLHAWPEYFDPARQLWLAVDPTWEDTSGLDYFSSLDLSHIAFVYQGKDVDAPLPPGVYKLNPQDKDIQVIPISNPPQVKTGYQVIWPKKIYFNRSQNNPFKIKLVVENNTIAYDVEIKLRDKESKQVLASQKEAVIAPLSQKEFNFTISKEQLNLGQGQTLELLISNQVVATHEYAVLSRLWYAWQSYGIWVVMTLTITVIIIVLKKRS